MNFNSLLQCRRTAQLPAEAVAHQLLQRMPANNFRIAQLSPSDFALLIDLTSAACSSYNASLAPLSTHLTLQEPGAARFVFNGEDVRRRDLASMNANGSAVGAIAACHSCAACLKLDTTKAQFVSAR